MDVKGAIALSERIAAATERVEPTVAATSASDDLRTDPHKTDSSFSIVDDKVQGTSC